MNNMLGSLEACVSGSIVQRLQTLLQCNDVAQNPVIVDKSKCREPEINTCSISAPKPSNTNLGHGQQKQSSY